VYRWLSAVFAKETDTKALAVYRSDGHFLDELSPRPEFKAAVDTIRKSLEQDLDLDDLAIELASEFSYLFLGVGGSHAAPPYESAYVSESGALYQDSTVQTERVLERYGLNVRPDIPEPADHIAFQLELMAVMAEREETISDDTLALRMLRAEQKDFLENHLMNWVPKFSRDCSAGSPGGFYDGIARLTSKILEEDHAYLSED